MKVADDARAAERGRRARRPTHIREAAAAIRERLARGGKLILFGNGGSATDANDWALDCVAPPATVQRRGALSPFDEQEFLVRQSLGQGHPEQLGAEDTVTLIDLPNLIWRCYYIERMDGFAVESQ